MSERIPSGPLRRESAVRVLLRRARAENSAGRPGRACAVLRRAVAIDPGAIAARVGLADCLRDVYRLAEAREVLETGLEAARRRGDERGFVACGNRLAALLVRRRELADARELLQRVIRADLDERGALSALTLVNLSAAMRGRWSLARRWRLLRGATRIAKRVDRVTVLRATGRLMLEVDDVDASLRAFEEAARVARRVKLPPARKAAVLADQGLALVKAGRYVVAVGVLRSAARLHQRVGNERWARRLSRLARRVRRAQRRLGEIAESN